MCSPALHNARSHLRVPGPERLQSPLRQLRGQERVITANRQTSWAFADAFVAEDEALRWARDRARDAGLPSVSPGTGAALRLLAATADAKAVAEIGTGTGVSGIYLLEGMRPDGVLTTVDPEPERQQFAKQAFRAAGFAGNRARFIPGRALDVLPASRTAATTSSSATATAPSAWTISLNRCACCDRVVWSASRASSRTAVRWIRRPSKPRCSGCGSC